MSRFLSFLSILLFERYSKNESAHLSKKVYRLLIIKTTHYSFIASEDGHLNSFHLEIPWGHLVPGLVLLFFTRVNIIHIADYPLKCLEVTLKVLTQVENLPKMRSTWNLSTKIELICASCRPTKSKIRPRTDGESITLNKSFKRKMNKAI